MKRLGLRALVVVLCLSGGALLGVVLNGGGADQKVTRGEDSISLAVQKPNKSADGSTASTGVSSKKAWSKNWRPGTTVRGSTARALKVPILMYHVIGNPSASAPNQGLWVSPADFSRQMALLKTKGYEAVTLEDVFRAWDKGAPIPRNAVVVSFDDGYLSHYTVAKPILESHHWPGVLNLVTNNIGPGGLSTNQVNKLIEAGWEIDSHTLTHPDLTTLDSQQLKRELLKSRQALKRKFHVPIAFFCYPAGRYNPKVVAAVKAAGYRGATTVDPGLGNRSEPFILKRIRVNRGDSAETVLSRLR